MNTVFSSKSFFLVCSLSFLILLSPLLTLIPLGSLFLTVMFTTILLSSVRIASDDRTKLFAIGLIVGLALTLLWAGEVSSSEQLRRFGEAFYVGVNIYVIYIILMTIVTSQQVDEEVLIGAVAVYLLLGITWALIFDLTYAINPESFDDIVGNREEIWNLFVYFSFSTLTTLGYGDIAALSPFARTLSVFEAIIGVIFEAIVIARLVGLYRRPDQKIQENIS